MRPVAMVPPVTGGLRMKFHFVLEIRVGRWTVRIKLTVR
jgi:hypothetical protein